MGISMTKERSDEGEWLPRSSKVILARLFKAGFK